MWLFKLERLASVMTEPDKNIIRTMLNNIDECTEMGDRIQLLTECFAYIAQFGEFLMKNTDLAYAIRCHAKNVEPCVNDLIILEQIDFEQGAALVQISQVFLDITSDLAEFDCDKIVLDPRDTCSSDDSQDTYSSDDDNEKIVLDSRDIYPF